MHHGSHIAPRLPAAGRAAISAARGVSQNSCSQRRYVFALFSQSVQAGDVFAARSFTCNAHSRATSGSVPSGGGIGSARHTRTSVYARISRLFSSVPPSFSRRSTSGAVPLTLLPQCFRLALINARADKIHWGAVHVAIDF